MKRLNPHWIWLIVALLSAMAVGVGVGATPLGVRRMVELLLSPAARAADPLGAEILLRIRLPRVAAAAIAGGCLSVSGCGLQALLRNPLADPYVLGVSAGASLGAAVVIALGASLALGGLAVPVAALIGALLATILVFGIARSQGTMPGATLLLAGVVIASVLGSLVSIVLFLAGGTDRMQQIVLWTMGGFGEADWQRVAAVCPLAIAAVLAMWAMGRDLNLLSFGEDSARFLGSDVERLKMIVVVMCAVLTASAVALGGIIGFVGLIVPHACRRVVGPDHRRLVPASLLLGAAFLTVADVAARTLRAPTELPVGLLTGLLGGPFFLALLRSHRGRE